MRLSPGKKLRILDFDIENRPLTYLGGDWTTADITAIAWGWEGEDAVSAAILGSGAGPRKMTSQSMLLNFLDAYRDADIVTGHYIRRHDLPIINGALMEFGLGQLPPKLTSDTKIDLKRRKELSASQESLSDMLGVTAPKEHMGQHDWRRANRLTPAGIEETRRRVVGDIKQHKELRQKLISLDLLGPPAVWKP